MINWCQFVTLTVYEANCLMAEITEPIACQFVTLTVYEANGRSTLLVIPEWKPSKQFCHFQPQFVLQYYYVLEIGTTI